MSTPDEEYRRAISTLRPFVYREPANLSSLQDILSFVRISLDYARRLTEKEMLGKLGDEIASNLCGALAWQLQDSSHPDGWLTEESFPELYNILTLSSLIDIDNTQSELWQKLLTMHV